MTKLIHSYIEPIYGALAHVGMLMVIAYGVPFLIKLVH